METMTVEQGQRDVESSRHSVGDYIEGAVGHWLLCRLLEAPERVKGLYVPRTVRVDTHGGAYKALVVDVGSRVNHEELGMEIKKGMVVWCNNNIQDAITLREGNGEYSRYIFVLEGDIMAVEG